ncbi:hypothetical protein D5F01_LYC00544 [Larimichthys crocea]|uniref:Uncharacterized protein n=1 Tax=Larimichthys crocea TaxID=215358 RepID=A0A6G0JAB4_LARCR|nr:hypothetical protein D5F01_LYC00544 [Larimichthys crocea]
MWQLLPRSSSRKRSGHRLPLQVTPVPIIFWRFPAGARPSTRSPSEQQIPRFTMRERGDQQCPCPLVLCCCNSLSLSLSLSFCPAHEWEEVQGECFRAGAPPALLPGEAKDPELRESAAVTADKLPRSEFAAPVSKTQQEEEEEEEGGGNGDFPSLVYGFTV